MNEQDSHSAMSEYAREAAQNEWYKPLVDQQQMPTGEAMFATDEELIIRWRQVEDTLADIAYRAGVAARELAALRKLQFPGSTDVATE